MKKIQNKLTMKPKNGFQPIPFFMALGFALPIHTATLENEASSEPIFASLTEKEMDSQISKADRKPARFYPTAPTGKKFLGLNLELNESALKVHQKNWQIDDGAIELLYFNPDNVAPTVHAELNNVE